MLDWSELNLRHLRAISSIAARGSVSAASQHVHLSQPALTQGIAKIERCLGVRLFERRSDGMTVTEAGALFSCRIDTAFRQLSDGFDHAGAQARGSETKLSSAQLRAFLAFARAGSFAGAAAQSGIAQPTLHRAVREVERLSNLKLYRRAGRGVQLSDSGHALVRAARSAVGEIEAGLSEIARFAGREIGTIRIGAMPLARAALAPAAVARFRSAHPDVGVEIVDGTYGALAERLKDGELHFLLGALRGPSCDPALAEEKLFDDLLSIVARPDHPLAGSASIDAQSLARHPWIVGRADTPHQKHWRRIFEDAGVDPPANPVICGSVVTIRELLGLGDFLALLSRDQVQRLVSVDHLALLGPPLESTRRPIGITVRADFRPTTLQSEMLDLVRSITAERNFEN